MKTYARSCFRQLGQLNPSSKMRLTFGHNHFSRNMLALCLLLGSVSYSGCLASRTHGNRSVEGNASSEKNIPAASDSIGLERGPTVGGREIVTYADVAPILAMHCNSCHGPEEDYDWWMPGFAHRKNINTRTYESLMGETDIGEIVVPGHPEESRLYTILSERYENGEPRMPFAGKPLTQEEMEVIRKWIADGAQFAEEPDPYVMQLEVSLPKPSVPDVALIEKSYTACLNSTASGPDAVCAEFLRKRGEYLEAVRASTLFISCRVDSNSYVTLRLQSHERSLLKERVATIKLPAEYADAATPGEWVDWTEVPDAKWRATLSVQLLIKYWKTGSLAIFVYAIGELPEEAKKIIVTPNPVSLAKANSSMLELWLPVAADISVRMLQAFDDRPIFSRNIKNLAPGKNNIDIPFTVPGEGPLSRGLYTLLIDVVPRASGKGGYGAAIAVWVND